MTRLPLQIPSAQKQSRASSVTDGRIALLLQSQRSKASAVFDWLRALVYISK